MASQNSTPEPQSGQEQSTSAARERPGATIGDARPADALNYGAEVRGTLLGAEGRAADRASGAVSGRVRDRASEGLSGRVSDRPERLQDVSERLGAAQELIDEVQRETAQAGLPPKIGSHLADEALRRETITMAPATSGERGKWEARQLVSVWSYSLVLCILVGAGAYWLSGSFAIVLPLAAVALVGGVIGTLRTVLESLDTIAAEPHENIFR